MMTSRLPSAHGVRCNGIPLNKDAVTFVDLLRAAGYRTSLAGKCHLQNMTDMAPQLTADLPPEGLQPPPPELSEALKSRWNSSDYDNEMKVRWRQDSEHSVKLPYYGFDQVDLCSYHGDLVEGEYYRWLCKKVDDPDALRGQENAMPDEDIVLTQAYRTRVPEHLYPTTWIADRAIDQLNAAKQDEKPFFLHCSFTDPHHPFTPPGRYWDMYDPDKVTLPRTSRHDPSYDLFSPLANLRYERENGLAKIGTTVAYSATEQEVRQAIALTYGMITMVDDSIGRILNHLRASGMDENTIVIFTSDHGDFMGDHGLLLKSALHYSNLIRVPFIWSDPESNSLGQSTSGLWSTLDIGPTVLERAGLAPSYGIQGRSFMEALDNPTAGGRPHLLIEEDGHAPTFGLDCPVRARTLVNDQFRLTIYDQENWGELYDLINDPDETKNMFDLPEASDVRHSLFEQLARSMLVNDDKLPLPVLRA